MNEFYIEIHLPPYCKLVECHFSKSDKQWESWKEVKLLNFNGSRTLASALKIDFRQDVFRERVRKIEENWQLRY